MVFDNEKEAQSVADSFNQSRSPLAVVHYASREMEPELAEGTLARRALNQKEEQERSGPEILP